MLLHPMRYRCAYCKDEAAGGKCRRDVCFFAHNEAELRQADYDSMFRYQVLMVRHPNTLDCIP